MDLVFSLTLLLSPSDASKYGTIIDEEAKRAGVDPYLVAAIIYRESRFNQRVCFRGAHGLMQIQLKDRGCGRRSRIKASRMRLYKIRNNIRRGIRLMSWAMAYCKRHGHRRHHWLLHYNQGGKVRTTGRVGGYAKRVLQLYRKLKNHQLDAI